MIKPLFLTLLISIVFISEGCKSDDDMPPVDEYKLSIGANLNGEPWPEINQYIVRRAGVNPAADSTYRFSIRYGQEDRRFNRLISFTRIYPILGTYRVICDTAITTSENISSFFIVDDIDVTLDQYRVACNSTIEDNYLTVNEVTADYISGTFNTTYIYKYPFDKFDPSLPDTLAFTDGWFSIKRE